MFAALLRGARTMFRMKVWTVHLSSCFSCFKGRKKPCYFNRLEHPILRNPQFNLRNPQLF